MHLFHKSVRSISMRAANGIGGDEHIGLLEKDPETGADESAVVAGNRLLQVARKEKESEESMLWL